MTQRQAQALAFIESYITANRYSPSYAEITRAIGCKSKNRAHEVVHALAVQGYITFLPHRARTIALVKREGAA